VRSNSKPAGGHSYGRVHNSSRGDGNRGKPELELKVQTEQKTTHDLNDASTHSDFEPEFFVHVSWPRVTGSLPDPKTMLLQETPNLGWWSSQDASS